jgi:hypothetical protein
MTKKIAVSVLSGALLAALLAGCGKKDGGSTAASGEAVGVAECDDYLKKVDACSAKATPENKSAMEASMKANRESWKEATKTEAGKEALKTGCKAALDAFIAANPGCK